MTEPEVGLPEVQGNLSDLVKAYDNALIICLRCALDIIEETKNEGWQTMNLSEIIHIVKGWLLRKSGHWQLSHLPFIYC